MARCERILCSTTDSLNQNGLTLHHKSKTEQIFNVEPCVNIHSIYVKHDSEMFFWNYTRHAEYAMLTLSQCITLNQMNILRNNQERYDDSHAWSYQEVFWGRSCHILWHKKISFSLEWEVLHVWWNIIRFFVLIPFATIFETFGDFNKSVPSHNILHQ